MNKLIDYCNTAYQRAVVEAYEKLGTANGVARALEKDVGTISRTIRRIKERFLEDTEPKEPEFTPISDIVKKGTKRFVITSALNDCPIHNKFWASLNQYSEAMNAALLVVACKYKNPNAFHTGGDESWPSEIVPNLVFDKAKLTKGLWLLGNVPISATAVNPLTGLDTISGGDSAIFGHAQQQLKCVATPQNKLPKILTTTGSVSRPFYSKSKAGVKAEHHHSLAATLVEVTKDGHFHIRQLTADRKGEFYDLDRHATPEGVTEGHRVEALITGDEHAAFACPKVRNATYDASDSICAVLKPKNLVRHDTLDFYARNHHHKGNVLTNFAKHHAKKHNVKAELELTVDYLNSTLPADCKQYVVRSNHDEALDKWLNSADPNEDPENALLFHQLQAARLESAIMTKNGVSSINPFEWFAVPRLTDPKRTKFLKRDEPLIIKGIDCSQHGDTGLNGARGSAAGLSKMGVKSVIGHSHTPCIFQGVYQGGTSSELRLEYNRGPSSWLNTHTMIYANGKRSLIHVIDGLWRLK